MPHFHLLPSLAAMSCVCCPRTSQASDYLVHLASHHSLPPSLPSLPLLSSSPLPSSPPSPPIPYLTLTPFLFPLLPSPPLPSQPHYKESQVYLARFQQFQSRALNLVKNHITTTIRSTTQSMLQPAQHGAGQTPSGRGTEESSYSLNYGKFKSSAPKVKVSAPRKVGACIIAEGVLCEGVLQCQVQFHLLDEVIFM